MSKTITLEVLIATPPTRKCEETIEVLKGVVRRYPDEARLVVFRRGIDFVPEEMRMELAEYVSPDNCRPKEASLQMRTLITKGRAVPTVVLDGEVFSTSDVPNLEELDGKVRELIKVSAG